MRRPEDANKEVDKTAGGDLPGTISGAGGPPQLAPFQANLAPGFSKAVGAAAPPSSDLPLWSWSASRALRLYC